MKYKVKQSIHSQLEKDLNDHDEQGYKWKCKLFSWDTHYNNHQEKLITYLIEKI